MLQVKSRTVSAVAVIDLANELLSRDVLSYAQLVTIYPEYETFTNNSSSRATRQTIQEARIEEQYLVDLWQAAEDSHVAAHLGVDIGCKVNEKAKGLLANWLSQSENLGQALAIFRENIALLNPSEQWTLAYTQDAQDCVLQFDFVSPYQYPRMAYERSMLALIAWGGYLCGEAIEVKEVGFAFSKPLYSDMLSKIFGEAATFDAPRNTIRLAAKTLEFPLLSANAYLHDVMSQRAQAILNSMALSSTLSQRVTQLIGSDIRFYSQIDTLADVLCMSRTTLYRRLKAENQTFLDILDEVRKQAAKEAVLQGQKIEAISYDLGFKDKRSFYKAYQRWFKQRPSDTLQSRAC